MSNPPTFSAGSDSASPLAALGVSFGQNNTNSSTAAPASGGSVFGSATNQTNQAPSSFGSSTAPKPGSDANTSSNNTPKLFGQPSSPGLFGNGSITGGTSLFGSKSNENNASSKSSPLFGQASTTTSNMFGGAPPASGEGMSTPTATKTSFSVGGPSTTPAGPPPSGPQSNPLKLGERPGSAPSSLFGNAAATKQGDSSTAFPSAMSFNNNKAQQSQPVPSASPSLFGSGANSSTNLFGAPNSAQPNAGNTSASFAEKSATTASEPGTAAQTTEQATSAKPSLFGAPASTGPTQPAGSVFTLGGMGVRKQDSGKSSPFAFPSPTASTAASGTSQPAFGLSPSLTSGPATSGATATSTSAPQANSLFGTTNATAAPSTNVFGNIGQKKHAAATESTSTAPTATSSGTAAPSTTAPAAGATLFGTAITNASASQTMTPGAASNSDTTTTKDAAPAASGLGNSTSGPAPSAQSRLKNKSMDEIITRWTSDLSKYQKEFQSQAERVSSWDRMLVENGNAISKLYSRTFQAERDTAELQRQLSAVEGHQEELSQWLDRYEREVDEMLARQVGQNDGVQGPDQERERTYKTAEKVSERLNEMGQNLTEMIEEINITSSSIQKTSRPDDPLSKIVRILNGHLSQLQTIDQGTSVLQEKVVAAQKESQRLGYRGHRGPGSDAVDDFYRSYSRRP